MGYYTSNDVYSFAIQLAFHLCIRISELIALKQKDVVIDTDNSYLYIQRATRKEQAVSFENDQLHFGNVEYVTADWVKSNKREGFRHYPLTSSAIATIQKVISLNLDGEYLFMRDNNQIYGDSFNRELKRVCNALEHTNFFHQLLKCEKPQTLIQSVFEASHT